MQDRCSIDLDWMPKASYSRAWLSHMDDVQLPSIVVVVSRYVLTNLHVYVGQ